MFVQPSIQKVKIFKSGVIPSHRSVLDKEISSYKKTYSLVLKKGFEIP